MSRTLILIGGVVILLSATQSALAFSTRPVDPATASERLADPDELADKMSNGQSGGTTFGVPGGHMMLQFSAPPSGGTTNSPFVTSPSTVFVPSRFPGALVTDESPRERGAARADPGEALAAVLAARAGDIRLRDRPE